MQNSSGDMVRYYVYYCLFSRRMDDLQCPSKSIGMSVLDELIKTALHQEIVLCEKQQEASKKRVSELYLKYHSGSLSLEEFQTLNKQTEKSIQERSERKEELQHRLDSMEREIREKGKFLRNLLKCNEKTKLTRDVIHTLISRIDVYAGHRVKITFAFRMNELLCADKSGESGKGGSQHEYKDRKNKEDE